MKISNLSICLLFMLCILNTSCNNTNINDTLSNLNWEHFLSQHDMYWTHLTTDPVEPTPDGRLKTGYYAGAIMGNGLLGTNIYKLKDNVYRINVGRSDVTEIRQPYDLFNSARLPIGYFTISTVGNTVKEEMRLSLYNAITNGTFTTDAGNISFSSYVHAINNYIVLESETSGKENDFKFDFVPYKAMSTRCQLNKAPAGYLNHKGDANPTAKREEKDGVQLLVQELVTDSTMSKVGKVYVVAWKEEKNNNKRRTIATVSQEDTKERAIEVAIKDITNAFSSSSKALERSHKQWWNSFYQNAAFMTFPDTRIESFYWAQYYKFASTTRPGKPIVDLQGVWPSWDTPWSAVWINLNLQLTYSWQTKANLGWLAQPLWESLYQHRDNLQKNVTDIPSQASWTDASCLGRTSSYDFHAALNPKVVESNQYEVGNLTWLLYYYWQYCTAYGDTQQLKERFFPMLKSAINLFFHIRTKDTNGKYGLPPTASPEYLKGNPGPNCNYDLANLRWGLKTLIDIDTTYNINDPMLDQWKDFLTNLIDFPYDEETGYKVSDTYKFEDTWHRHYSHLFMIYPYHIVDWQDANDRKKIELSVNHWQGNQGYSRTGKASMLLSMNKGNEALEQMQIFFDKFIKPNTLYAETGPVIETPMAAMSTLHDFYLQDWGKFIRVFYGTPEKWSNASFANLRALGGFLVSATRQEGNTVYVQVKSECGNQCQLQTAIPLDKLVIKANGKAKTYEVVNAKEGIIRFNTEKNEIIELSNSDLPIVTPSPIEHPNNEHHYYGDGFFGNR